jgi:hypothetical protein
MIFSINLIKPTRRQTEQDGRPIRTWSTRTRASLPRPNRIERRDRSRFGWVPIWPGPDLWGPIPLTSGGETVPSRR